MFDRPPKFLIFAVILLTGCSTAPYFTKPKVDALTPVTVSGYLKFGFENRNLYPSENWRGHAQRNECLPVGIHAADAVLLAEAKRLDGHRVTVTGKIDRVLGADEVNASFCKDVGLIAERIVAR